MGYQRVDILLKSGDRIKDVVVFNATEVELSTRQGFKLEDIADIKLK